MRKIAQQNINTQQTATWKNNVEILSKYFIGQFGILLFLLLPERKSLQNFYLPDSSRNLTFPIITVFAIEIENKKRLSPFLCNKYNKSVSFFLLLSLHFEGNFQVKNKNNSQADEHTAFRTTLKLNFMYLCISADQHYLRIILYNQPTSINSVVNFPISRYIKCDACCFFHHFHSMETICLYQSCGICLLILFLSTFCFNKLEIKKKHVTQNSILMLCFFFVRTFHWIRNNQDDFLIGFTISLILHIAFSERKKGGFS